MRRASLLAVTLLAVVLVACGCRFGGGGGGEESQLPVEKARAGEFRVTIEEVGVLRAISAHEIKAQRWGQVKKVLDDGTPVKAGEAVLWFDTAEIEQYVRVLDAELAESQGQMDKQAERMSFQEKSAQLDIAVSEANLAFEGKKLALARKSSEDAA